MANKVRDPKKEAELRMKLMLAGQSMALLSRLTRTPIDDVAVAEFNEAVFDEARWNRIADAIWGS